MKRKKTKKITKAKLKEWEKQFFRKLNEYNEKYFKDNVRARDNYKCVICGNESKTDKALHVMHIIPEEFELTRYDENNALTGCYSCHKVSKNSWHLNPLFGVLWLKNNRPEQYNYVIEKMKLLNPIFAQFKTF